MAGGALPLAFVNLNPPVLKMEFEWQLSQPALPKAMWFAGGSTSVGGAMLAKLKPDAWQLAQLSAVTTL